MGRFQSTKCCYTRTYSFLGGFLISVFIIFIFSFFFFFFFFWETIKFPQQNIDQSETRIGDNKLHGFKWIILHGFFSSTCQRFFQLYERNWFSFGSPRYAKECYNERMPSFHISIFHQHCILCICSGIFPFLHEDVLFM